MEGTRRHVWRWGGGVLRQNAKHINGNTMLHVWAKGSQTFFLRVVYMTHMHTSALSASGLCHSTSVYSSVAAHSDPQGRLQIIRNTCSCRAQDNQRNKQFYCFSQVAWMCLKSKCKLFSIHPRMLKHFIIAGRKAHC